MLGYPTRMKAYKLLDIETNRIFVLRDVVFHEQIFPLLTSSVPTNDDLDLFNKIVLPLPSDDVGESRVVKSYDMFMSGSGNSSPSHDDDVAGQCDDLHFVTHSSRQVKPPSYLQDYNCALLFDDSHILHKRESIAHPLSQNLNYDQLAHTFKAVALVATVVFEPMSYNQACGIPEWEQATKDEIQALENNKILTVVSLLASHHVIGSK